MRSRLFQPCSNCSSSKAALSPLMRWAVRQPWLRTSGTKSDYRFYLASLVRSATAFVTMIRQHWGFDHRVGHFGACSMTALSLHASHLTQVLRCLCLPLRQLGWPMPGSRPMFAMRKTRRLLCHLRRRRIPCHAAALSDIVSCRAASRDILQEEAKDESLFPLP